MSTITGQRKRVRAALRKAGSRGKTTIDLREKHDVMMPASRIYELRHNHGCNIQLMWDKSKNAQGNLRRVARYVLLRGKWKGAA